MLALEGSTQWDLKYYTDVSDTSSYTGLYTTSAIAATSSVVDESVHLTHAVGTWRFAALGDCGDAPWMEFTATTEECLDLGTRAGAFEIFACPSPGGDGEGAGHGERSRSQLLSEFGGTENRSILAGNALAVNVLAVNSVS